MRKDKIKLSVVVMASRDREHYFEYLRNELGDVPFSIDEPKGKPGHIGIWKNCKRAWQMHDKTSDWAITIQDDALLSKDFLKSAIDFIVNNPNPAYQFYWGNDYEPTEQDIAKGFVKREMAWGVAICLRTDLIDEMIRFGNGYFAWQDDVKIKYFLKSKGIKTLFPIPCLVDHRKLSENPTLTPCVDSEKRSKYFKA